ncbi:MAG: cell division protein ZapA [Deltaproteobacteria bacterium]|jgi:cell division protein ZapA (FtsZ GTPase activity inhibitor)|nr:cell division protein ZapA [Deltaproteobacteria bacterium]
MDLPDAPKTLPDPQPAGQNQAEVVDVEVLKRHYQIRSDQPELINRISRLVNDQAASIRSQSLKADLSDLDILVQVTFRLAVSLYHGRRELETLKDHIHQAETRVEGLTAAIEKLLPPQ